ncbi:MAG: hypothetical protein HY707_04420 [Ignavibacteriae bacterium]|nr:hypothetical protein [Ignavibacteriota bacterium]
MKSVIYLNRTYASTGETIQYLEMLFQTKSLSEEALYKNLRSSYERLSAMIFKFMNSVVNRHETPFYVKEDNFSYDVDLDTEICNQ